MRELWSVHAQKPNHDLEIREQELGQFRQNWTEKKVKVGIIKERNRKKRQRERDKKIGGCERVLRDLLKMSRIRESLHFNKRL